jgi:hypothetical protein
MLIADAQVHIRAANAAEDKEWTMGRGLCEWLGWELP